MAVTKDQLFTLISSNLPDNDTGAITPSGLRQVFTQTADSMIYSLSGVREVALLRAFATTDQIPTALGTALQVTFGASQGSALDPVMINAAGLITFNLAGTYSVRYRLQFGRVSGTAGTATLISRLMLASGQFGSSTSVRLDNATNIVAVEGREILNMPTSGSTMYIQIVRDSVGSSINAGGLYVITPATSGWNVAPSALVMISRMEQV